jgi:hypothetical protein
MQLKGVVVNSVDLREVQGSQTFRQECDQPQGVRQLARRS